MRILVTGGSGWIGHHVCRELQDRDHVPVVFDRTSGGDVTDHLQLKGAIRDCGAVIHLAGVLGTHELFANPQEAVDVNVRGTLNVLEACRPRRTRYVGMSMPDVNPSLYAATKVCARRLADAYAAAYRIPVSHVVAYNAFGAGQPYGNGHPQKIVPTFSRAAWEGHPIPIWGDGSLAVDLVHVVDVARIVADALNHDGGHTFDAGTGLRWSVLNVARTVHGIVGNDTGCEFLPPRLGERTGTVAGEIAAGAGWDVLGWHPEFDYRIFQDTVNSYGPAPTSQPPPPGPRLPNPGTYEERDP